MMSSGVIRNAALALLCILGISETAWACQCADEALVSKSDCVSKSNCDEVIGKSRKRQAVLILKGKMQSVLVGAKIDSMTSAPAETGAVVDNNVAAMTLDSHAVGKFIEGRFKIEKVLKGKAEGDVVGIVTGFGMGDCGLLSQFIGSYYYNADIELGVSKRVVGGRRVYYADMCSYQKYPKQ